MEESLYRFLNEIKLEMQYFEYFEEANLINAEYFENSKRYLVYLEFLNVLPIEVYTELENKVKDYQLNMKVIYHIKQANYLAQHVYDYYNYFIEKFFLNENTSYLKKIKLEYNRLDLNVILANEGLMLMYNPFKTKLESLMELAGFNIQYTYTIDQSDSLNQQIDDLIKSEENVSKTSVNVNKTSNDPIINQVANQTRTSFKKSLKDLSSYEVTPIIDIYDDYFDICIEGFVFDADLIKTKNNKHIQTLKLTDFTDSMLLKRFESSNLSKENLMEIKKGMWIKAYGDVRFDNFAKEHVMFLKAIQTIKPKVVDKYDLSIEKRVELHLHTNMSTMDGVSHISEYLNQALKYGHTALAITDHNNVQAYPDAYNDANSRNLKIIYGMESNLIDDNIKIVFNENDLLINDASYVFFDFETTGLKAESDQIIEIGAVKYQNGLEVDRFQSFVKPTKKVSLFIKELTGISDRHLENAPYIEDILPDFVSFYDGSVLVAHNATFDMSFLNFELKRQNIKISDHCVIDTLQLSRVLDKTRKFHNLGTCAKKYGVAYNQDGAHRADYDALVLAQVFEGMRQDLHKLYNIENINEINKLCDHEFLMRQRPYHCSILAKNQDGLKELFKLVSIAHTKYFYNEPNLFKSIINEHRSNLLIGSGCINGEIYQQAKAVSEVELIKIMEFYDYIEVFPIENQFHLIDLGEYTDKQEIQDVTKYIIDCAKKANKDVVACGDAHYVLESAKEFRDVYISALGIGGKIHPLYDRKHRIKNNPDQHFRSTNEMLDCFNFLESDLAFEIVVTNTNKIANSIDDVKPIKDKLYTPTIKGVDKKLIDMCYKNAYQRYGNDLPLIVKERLEKELESITKHGFSVVYYISSQLVAKSLEDGYLVGSRGSVGSSLVATLSNITEVNPLVAHYYCPNCTYSEFFEDGQYSSGYDLPDKNCPKCNKPLKGDGQDIPFETFLGFEGDKVPDIDLNFSSEYQSTAHNYTKKLFGEDHVFKAGTIQTVQNKTAYGYARGYHEKSFINHEVRSTEYERLAQGCEGVKRTTGQHPGGIIVIPENMDVHDFTPINYPADDLNSNWKTTHFDFHAIHDNVLKLDILGHVDPTALRLLQDMTGIDPKTIPTNDQKVLSLFSSNDGIGISDKVNYKNAAIGIPEFGTFFVRSMLEETNPKTFAELVQISGLSHGTDVWLNNAQSLIKRGICQLKDVIGCRDDIMVYLMYRGLNPKLAFTIMESVRKGKGLKDEWIKEMQNNNVPQWYIDSCLKIKYMFPKAHAVAYVLMAIRVAWFKVYYPLEYYAVYFTTRCDVYDIETMSKGIDALKAKISEIKEKGFEASDKEKKLVDVFEISLELYYRGFSILPVDIDKSKASEFSVDYDNNAILPSFISIDGLGINVAETIIKARNEKAFISKEDFEKRTQVNKNHIAYLERINSINHLQDLNQLSLF